MYDVRFSQTKKLALILPQKKDNKTWLGYVCTWVCGQHACVCVYLPKGEPGVRGLPGPTGKIGPTVSETSQLFPLCFIRNRKKAE